MRLIENWKEAWKWFSMWALAAIGTLPFVWVNLPSDVKAFLPEGWEPYVLLALVIAGGIGRLVDQSKKEPG